VEAMLARHAPWAVVNAAGYVRVDDAEEERDRCRRENVTGAAVLAEACAGRRIQLLSFSSDLVFDGAKDSPYVESDGPRPLNVYGASKAEAEAVILDRCPEALVVRTSAFFGPWDAYNFVTATLRALREGKRVPVVSDVTISATYVPDLVDASLDLLIDGESGLWHLSNPGPVTWLALAERAMDVAGVSSGRIEPRRLDEMGLRAARPRYCALGSERGQLLPPLDDALRRYVAAIQEAAGGRPETAVALEA